MTGNKFFKSGGCTYRVMTERLKRISVAVDTEIDEKLRMVAKKENKTVSEIIRNAIGMYFELGNGNGMSPEKTVEYAEEYAEILSTIEHVIVDIEIWTAMLDELNRVASDEFWKAIERIGYEHALQYKMRGFTKLKDVLDQMEDENWFRAKMKGNVYTIILSARSEQRLLRVLLRGILKALEVEAEVIDGLKKIIIIEKSRGG